MHHREGPPPPSASPPSASRPGLRKAAAPPLYATRAARLVRSHDAGWRALFDAADTISEGALRDEADGPVWYGTTSVILAIPGPSANDGSADEAARAAAGDVHVRTRALRAALREAALRCPHALGPASCDVTFAVVPGGLRIDVDVQAPLKGARRRPLAF
jgi:hypothetical protein